ncbi:restriction endonuclease [Verrucomicrobiota bacterium]
MSEKTIWGIHAGRTGDADSLFLRHNVIALGWVKMGNIGELPGEREAFKARMMEVMPDKKPGYYPNAAGQLYRFVHEMKEGDLVVYPSKKDKHMHIGEITGSFKYATEPEPGYPQQRPVKWLKDFPRTRFSQGALYETGSAMSFFQIKNYADEFISALTGEQSAEVPEDDPTVSVVAEEIEQSTVDFILKMLSQELKGHPFADFVGHLLNVMGYKTRIAPEGPDGGVDIVAHKDELGFEPPIIKVQVKSTEGTIGDPVVSQLYGKVETGEFGMVVTLGSFSNQAISFARNKSNLRLVDGNELVDMILAHYEKFDSKYKGLLPLRRVYVPEKIEDSERG